MSRGIILYFFFKKKGVASCKAHACLIGDANDTAGRTTTGVASLLGFLVAALAKVVGSSVHDNGALLYIVSTFILDEKERDWRKRRTPITLSEPISLISLSVTEP